MENSRYKFRAWDKQLKRMVYPNQFGYLIIQGKQPLECLIAADGWIRFQNGFGISPTDENFPILMQFTGLYDKNKKPVYEGDILECQDMHDSNVDRGWSKGNPKEVVMWKHDGYIIPHDLYYWTVIGNIHEHSHLLDKSGDS